MKKLIFVLAVCSGLIAMWIAFSPQPRQLETSEEQPSLLKPGSYRVEFAEPDSRGWKAFFVMEVNTSGEIAEVNFDYLSVDGKLKTQDSEYNTRMKAVNGLGPGEYCPRFAKNLIVYQDPDQIDGITGATSSYHGFKMLAQAAFAAARTGSQETVYISQPQEANHGDGGGN
ncbi:MAG: FMN-binding protein [Peptococcaceae bacterium]